MQQTKSIEDVRHSIASVPWDRLAHAYHGAWDAPAKLEVFLDPASSKEALDKAVEWMWASILHQGSIYSASPPVLWILIDLIAARPNGAASAAILRAVQTITDGLAYFGDSNDDEQRHPVLKSKPGEPLYEVWCDKALPNSNDVEDNEDYFVAIHVRSSLLRDLVRHAISVIRLHLKNSESHTRTAAVAAGLGALQVVPDEAKSLFGLILAIGDPAYDPGVWVSVAMVFGRLGYDMSELLPHADRRVRFAAAMSSSTLGDQRSVKELASAVSEPEWLEAEFPSGVAHLDMHLRFHALRALLERIQPENAEPYLIDAICTLIRKRAHKYTVDHEWGPVVHWAFHERLIQLPHSGATAPLPDTLTSAQAAILRTLCAKADLWDPSNGNASLAFKYVQLPYDRKALGRLIPN